MFRKTGLGQQIQILPQGGEPAGPDGARQGSVPPPPANPDAERRLELLEQSNADPNGWRTTQPAPGRGR